MTMLERSKVLVTTTSVAALMALTLAACGSGSESSGGASEQPKSDKTITATQTTQSSTSAKATGSTVKVRNVAPYGKILTDTKGRTLYLFTKEKSSKSECYGACAKAWPPFFTKGKPKAGKGVTASKLGTTKRTDGKTLVTYDDHPLYYYVDEAKAGQVLCQGVDEFGGVWYVVSPSGDAITTG